MVLHITKAYSTNLLIAFLLGVGMISSAQTGLKFNSNGSFKIVQFTDTHFEASTEGADSIVAMIREVLAIEKPDMVVFSGDVVTHPPFEIGWMKITDPVVEACIPWAATLGNHDDDHDQRRDEILPMIAKIPFCIAKEGENTVYGHGNYVIPINGFSGKKAASLIYCMDSNKYPVDKGYMGHDAWFDFSQVNWYRQESNQWKEKNNGITIPSLAFFHIPLPEYSEAWENSEIEPVGVKNEKVCCPVINTGMFAAMVEQGDVMGTFVGHDHVNDFVASLYGIALCYGRFSGSSNTYGNLLQGARVIVLDESKRQFTTWLRLKDGRKINKVLIEGKAK